MPPCGNARIAASARRSGTSLEITGAGAMGVNFLRAGIIDTLSLLKHTGAASAGAFQEPGRTPWFRDSLLRCQFYACINWACQ
jgi:hypothetical protein